MNIFKTYEINVDTMKETQVSGIVFNQGDRNTAKLIIRVLHNGEVLDLTNHSVKIALLKKDTKRVYQECAVIDAENGIVEVVLTTQSLVLDGKVECELNLSFGGDKTMTSTKFSFEVEKSIMNDSVLKSTNEIPPLQNVLEMGARFNAFSEELASMRSIIGSLTPTLDSTIVNVKNFGAKGDGVDDTQAIEAAQLHARTVNGDNSPRMRSIVYFPNGVYVVNKSIRIGWRIIFRGESEKLTVIKAKNGANLDNVINTVGSMHTGIEKIIIDGNKDNNGAKDCVLLQGTEEFENIDCFVHTLVVRNAVECGLRTAFPAFGIKGIHVLAYNCGTYGIHDGATDTKFIMISAWKCKKAGLYVTGANNHYVNGKHSFNGTAGDLDSANIIITNTRHTFTSFDTQDGPSHGVIFLNAYDNIFGAFLSDCNGDKNETDNKYCGFKFINSRNNIVDMLATNGFHGLYPGSQHYGLWMDKKSERNVINYLHSNQVVPMYMENYNNTINGTHLLTDIKNQYKYDNKGVLVNKYVNSNFADASSWSGGYRTTLSVANNTASFTTTGEHARLCQNFVPEAGKTYFFRCDLKTSNPNKVSFGIEGFNNIETKRAGANEFGEMCGVSTIPLNSSVTTQRPFGLYITESDLYVEVKNMICYELPEELAKLTLHELCEVISYNNMNLHGNNDIGLGNGYKLSLL